MDSPTHPLDAAADTDYHAEPDESEGDVASNVAVGDASPLCSTRFLRTYSPNEEHLDGVASELTVANSDEHSCPPTQPTTRLALNEANLADFETSIKQGTVPLRADIVGETYQSAKDDGVSKVACQASMSILTNHCAPSDAMGSTSTTHFSRFDTYDSGACSLHNVHSQQHHRQREPYKMAGQKELFRYDADKLSAVSVEALHGSPVQISHTDPLNEENLQLHLNDLRSGRILPLRPENIVCYAETLKAHNHNSRDDIPSLMVEPSEAEVPVSECSAHPSERTHSMSDKQQRTMMHLTESLDEFWSTCSTGTVDKNESSSAVLEKNHLSKESLKQLRRQLERGEAPLRPELLAGLGDFVKAFRQTCPQRSASLAVEVPDEHDHNSRAEDTGMVYSSNADLFNSGDTTERQRGIGLASPLPANSTKPFSGRRNEYLLNSSSFHSTMVEVAATDGIDDNGDEMEDDDDRGEDMDRNECDDVDIDDVVDDGVSNDANQNRSRSSGPRHHSQDDDVDDDDVVSVHDTEEELTRLSSCVSKLFKVTAENQVQYHSLTSALKQLANRQNSDHKIIAGTEERVVDTLARPIASLQQHIIDIGKSLANMQIRMSELEAFIKMAERGKNGDTVRLTLRYAHSNNLPTTFVVPMAMSATIGDCKSEFLKRLRSQELIGEEVQGKNCLLLLGDEEHVLFDGDSLSAVFPDVASSGSHPTIVSLRVVSSKQA